MTKKSIVENKNFEIWWHNMPPEFKVFVNKDEAQTAFQAGQKWKPIIKHIKIQEDLLIIEKLDKLEQKLMKLPWEKKYNKGVYDFGERAKKLVEG